MIISTFLIYSQILLAESVVGPLNQPSHLKQYGGVDGGGTGGGGLVGLMNNGITLITVVAGVYMLYNIIMAGFTYVMHGDSPEELKKANTMINMSIVGLIIMVGSFMIAGLVSYVLFGNAEFILNPMLYTQ